MAEKKIRSKEQGIRKQQYSDKFAKAKKMQKAFKNVNRGYVSSYLDLSVNKPGKYGVDY